MKPKGNKMDSPILLEDIPEKTIDEVTAPFDLAKARAVLELLDLEVEFNHTPDWDNLEDGLWYVHLLPRSSAMSFAAEWQDESSSWGVYVDAEGGGGMTIDDARTIAAYLAQASDVAAKLNDVIS
jgi:hypothetical protein